MLEKPAKNGNGAVLGFEETLWKAADKLRNNLDAAEYKHVVLGLIFLKSLFLFLCICILFIFSWLLKKSISRLWLQPGSQQIQDPLLIGLRNADLMEFRTGNTDLLSANGLQARDHVFKSPLSVFTQAV